MPKNLKNKIRIKLESFESKRLNIACQNIITKLKIRKSGSVGGPIPLPTKKRIYCVLRSPCINKDSREHFEIKTYRRVLDIFLPNDEIKSILFQIKLPSGVRATITKL